MSSKWVGRMHGFLPLNSQEENLKELLDKLQISHRIHAVFPVGGRTLVVDSFLPDLGLIIECWMSESRQGTALAWLERNAAFVDVKFARLKLLNPQLQCLGFVTAPRADSASLRLVVVPMMAHADFMAFSLEELENRLRSLLRRKSTGGFQLG
jgi:hypothetical protein